MKKNNNSLFFTCSLIELIGRTTRQKRSDVVSLMGENIVSHIYQHADTLHCEPIAKTADYYIDFCHIPTGDFDNVASCKYAVPTYWDIGKVYARLIEDIQMDDVMAALMQVYHSKVSDSISYYNSDFFYQPRDFIKEEFLAEVKAEAGKSFSKPAIRFRGFTDAWEQRKLGEIGITYTGLSGKTKDDFGHGEAHFVTYLNVFSNPVTNPQDVEQVEIDAAQNPVEQGDVFFTTSSETPEEVGMSSVYVTPCPQNTYLNSFCFGYRPKEKLDPYYLAHMLRADGFRKSIVFLAQGISRYNISKNKVMEIAVPIPEASEQIKIGQFFQALDTLLTLHQREHIVNWRFYAQSNKENRFALHLLCKMDQGLQRRRCPRRHDEKISDVSDMAKQTCTEVAAMRCQ